MSEPNANRPESPHPSVTLLITGHFREGASYSNWRRRGTEDYLLLWTRAGHGRIGYPGGEIITHPGDVVLLRPGTLHDYSTARANRNHAAYWELLWTHFLPRPNWLPLLAWPEVAKGLLLLSVGEPARSPVENALWEMNTLARGGLPRREEWAMNALERALLLCDSVNPRHDEARLDPRIQRTQTYLLEHLGEPVSLDEAARIAGLSPSRLSHLFRQQTGQTPQRFVEKARITRARQLLRLTGRSIAAIAEEVGFANPFYFTLRFKKNTGLSPTEYRRRETSADAAMSPPEAAP